jgi:hypothetical protein
LTSTPPLRRARVGLHARAIGLCFGGGVLVNTMALPRVSYTVRQLGAPVTIGFGLLFAALALTLIALSTTVVHVAVAIAALGFAAPFTLVPTLEWLTTLAGGGGPTETAPYGAIYATYNFAYAGGIFLGPLVGGAAVTALGPQIGLALPAAVPLLLGIAMFAGLAGRGRRRRAMALG